MQDNIENNSQQPMWYKASPAEALYPEGAHPAQCSTVHVT